jgi:hypothetical protein
MIACRIERIAIAPVSRDSTGNGADICQTYVGQKNLPISIYRNPS